MIDTFTAIFDKHEADDSAQARDSELFMSAVKREFANSEEILNTANALSVTARDFVSGKAKDFPVIPVRKSAEFFIKKHKQSQFPYSHSHEFYELIYVHKGKCLQKLSDGSELILSEKQCAVLPPYTVHSVGKCGSKDIILKMAVPCEIFEVTGGEIFNDLSTGEVRAFGRVSETGEFAVLKLLEGQYRKNKFKDAVIKSYLTILFAELTNLQNTGFALETLLCRYFSENVKTASLAGFAELKSYNQNYVSRLIKQRTGKSFSELLSRFRINMAKDLLIESGLSVEDIAFNVGYSSPSGLYRQFFAVFGMKPAEYRNLFR